MFKEIADIIYLFLKEEQMDVFSGIEEQIWTVGLKIFLLVWIIFVPVAITARLERIVKLLQDKK